MFSLVLHGVLGLFSATAVNRVVKESSTATEPVLMVLLDKMVAQELPSTLLNALAL